MAEELITFAENELTKAETESTTDDLDELASLLKSGLSFNEAKSMLMAKYKSQHLCHRKRPLKIVHPASANSHPRENSAHS